MACEYMSSALVYLPLTNNIFPCFFNVSEFNVFESVGTNSEEEVSDVIFLYLDGWLVIEVEVCNYEICCCFFDDILHVVLS